MSNPTEGQRLLKADRERTGNDFKAMKNGLVSNAISAKLIMQTDNNLTMQDAEILDGEIMNLKVIAFNQHHPEHRYADLTQVNALLVKIHNDIQAT
jgi:hypothetical protein